MGYNITVIGSAFEEPLLNKIRSAAGSCGCRVSIYPDPESARGCMADTHILFAPSNPQTAALLPEASKLKWFASYFAGVDPLLVPGVLPEDVIITNGSGAFGVTIAEHLIMVCLMMLRRYPEYSQMVQNREFRSDLMIRSLYGATVVVCGTGDIGSNFAKRLRAFCPAAILGVSRSGKRIDGFDRVVPVSQLDEVLPQADILVLTLPGTAETDNLITRERIALLKKDAYLVNVGRGNCLDQDAVLDALREGRLAGAALDVFRQEPVPAEDPAWDTEGLLFTPHCSGKMTMEYTRNQLVEVFCDNLPRFCRGESMTHVVNRTLGY